ncbi:hypothetical protein DSCOOX_01680 [Desulfosarcina ovata subsp. ovata]|uniref:Uncharacterized protein n=1 Tax=Desulfosarcina ovata subsp. ovata TaxID=2752305 RepID=A0A5K8A3L6_9BACT|nr:hypothetical protein DSCOOX_01680 [Desulfosarcina ovata subsp. ovata]
MGMIKPSTRINVNVGITWIYFYSSRLVKIDKQAGGNLEVVFSDGGHDAQAGIFGHRAMQRQQLQKTGHFLCYIRKRLGDR